MNRLLFAGPSIYGLDLQHSGDLVIRPPAACGDILRAAREEYRTIGLVDGLFGSERSVWHKEILFALSKGVRVLGAASMGALRAAECDRFGMEGVGRIYRDYRDGRRLDDGDVALLHAPAEFAFKPLTVALVDVEETVAGMRDGARVSRIEAQALLAAARRLHFTQRTWAAVARDAGMREEDIAPFRVEQKAADALALVARMQAPPEAGAAGDGWSLNETLYLSRLEGSLP
jgi:hypothetical protein